VGARRLGRVRVGPREIRTLTVPLRPAGGTCVVLFAVSPTAVPAVVTNGQNPDPRALGIHFNRFSYSP